MCTQDSGIDRVPTGPTRMADDLDCVEVQPDCGSHREDNRGEVIGVMEQPLLHRPEEVAVQLGLSRRKVFALIRDGRLRSVKIDHSRRVLDRHLRDFVDQLVVAPE
jgi:excisionase family DNA binding protein